VSLLNLSVVLVAEVPAVEETTLLKEQQQVDQDQLIQVAEVVALGKMRVVLEVVAE
jgi:hypothetical protein